MSTRSVMRAPVGVYRAGLGFLFGQRMLLLEHVGRRSGASRHTVLEVVGRPAPGRYLVASGFGESADWFRNVVASPSVRISVGRLRLAPAEARVLTPDQAAPALRRYADEHAVAWRLLKPVLARLTPDLYGDPDQLATRIPLVELTLLESTG